MNNKKELAVKFKDSRGELVTLTGSIVRDYISTDPKVTEKEVFMFLQISRYLHLNPFLKEIYLVKYQGQPAQYIVSYRALLMRAEAHKAFDGIDVKVQGKTPELTATATVYRKDRSHPTVVTVDYNEVVKLVYDRRTGKKRPMGPWATMPKWMLRKTAIARAIREAFPSIVGPAGSIHTTDTPEPETKGTIKESEPIEEQETDVYGDIADGKTEVYPAPPVHTETGTVKTEKETETPVKEPAEKKVKEKPATQQQKDVILKLASQLGIEGNMEKSIKEGINYKEAVELIEELQDSLKQNSKKG